MKKFLLIAASLVIMLLVWSLRPVNTSRENSVSIRGIVKNVEEAGYKDAVFRLKGQSGTYYINRGLQRSFSLDELKKLEGQEVEFMYADQWSILMLFFTPGWHITELKYDGVVVYSEF